MKKLALKIYLNNELITTSGIAASGSVSQTLTLRNDAEKDEQVLTLQNVGYLIESGEHYKWIESKVNVNDKITVEVVEDAGFDAPKEVYRDEDSSMNSFILAGKLKTYYRLKEELKEHLSE